MAIQICTLVLALLNFMTLSSFMIIMAYGAHKTKKKTTKTDIQEAWDSISKSEAKERADDIMLDMSEEVAKLAKKDQAEKEADKEQEEINQLLNAHMSKYKNALENTLTSIMEGTDE